MGSHIDSVPEGGNYDGDVGSLGAIEVAQTLRGESSLHASSSRGHRLPERGRRARRERRDQRSAERPGAGSREPQRENNSRRHRVPRRGPDEAGGRPAAARRYRRIPGAAYRARRRPRRRRDRHRRRGGHRRQHPLGRDSRGLCESRRLDADESAARRTPRRGQIHRGGQSCRHGPAGAAGRNGRANSGPARRIQRDSRQGRRWVSTCATSMQPRSIRSISRSKRRRNASRGKPGRSLPSRSSASMRRRRPMAAFARSSATRRRSWA